MALLLASVPSPAAEGKADSLVGEATTVDAASRHLTLKTDRASSVLVTLPEGTRIVRARPGATNLADATPLTLDQIAPGDRVMVRGTLAGDQGTLTARQVVVMSRDDIAHKQEEERAQWRRRGVLGVVKTVDATKGEVTLQLGRAASAPVLIVEAGGGKAAFRRYAPDSVKFSDARPSSLGEVRPEDQLRALGDRSRDGTRLVAEQVVFGTFRTVAGTVTSLDAGAKELTLRDDESGKRLSVTVGPDARIRRIPAEMGARLARWREAPGGPAGGGEAGRARRGPGSGPEDFLERLPPTSLAELKTGDRVLVSSTAGSDPARLTAIALLAGLETLAPPARPGRPRGAEAGLPADLMDLGLSIP